MIDLSISFYNRSKTGDLISRFTNDLNVFQNTLVIGVKKGYKENKISIVSALDNLVKGAAGQAIQNFNVMNEFEETKGIINE